jgi:hypothetical protein
VLLHFDSAAEAIGIDWLSEESARPKFSGRQLNENNGRRCKKFTDYRASTGRLKISFVTF